MIEFCVTAKELKRAIRMILSCRAEFMDKDTADFIVSTDELQLCSTGTSTTIHAAVYRAGYARVPLQILKNLRRAAATFKPLHLRIRIECGRFRVESLSFSHPGIELMQLGRRIADLPMDASVLDTLALQKLFSPEEIAESGLAARVVEAQERAIQAVDWASARLKEFGVSREAVADLLDNHIASHAKSVKAVMNK